MTFLFPLPYNGSPEHDDSWERAKKLVGKRVKVVREKGDIVTGVVERYEVSSSSERTGYGVGFLLRCGSERFPYSVPVNAALKSIEVV